MPFSVCGIAGLEIAIIHDRPISDDEETRLVSIARPVWIDVIAMARLTSPVRGLPVPGTMENHATVDARILVPTDADPSLVAFAAACALYNAGTIVSEPAHCSVTVDGRNLRATLIFDWDTESWFGTVDSGV